MGAGAFTAKVVVDPDGTVTLYTALRDTGTGFYTVLRQIIGEELGVPYNEIPLVTWTTDDLSFDTGVGGSRVTYVGGQATYGAKPRPCATNWRCWRLRGMAGLWATSPRRYEQADKVFASPYVVWLFPWLCLDKTPASVNLSI